MQYFILLINYRFFAEIKDKVRGWDRKKMSKWRDNFKGKSMGPLMNSQAALTSTCLIQSAGSIRNFLWFGCGRFIHFWLTFCEASCGKCRKFCARRYYSENPRSGIGIGSTHLIRQSTRNREIRNWYECSIRPPDPLPRFISFANLSIPSTFENRDTSSRCRPRRRILEVVSPRGKTI